MRNFFSICHKFFCTFIFPIAEYYSYFAAENSLLKMTISFNDIPVLGRSNVKMKDPNSVLEKINRMVSSKKDNLQVITDYDFTLTKQHVNGESGLSSFGLLSLWDKLPPGFMDKDQEIKSKYYPIERDLRMTPEEKTPYMIEWYKTCEALWNGVRFDVQELRNLIAQIGPQLRDGTVDLCKLLEKHQIPVLVLSAGLGDVISEVLKYHGLVENDYLHVISNFFKIEDGKVVGYGCRENGLFIHPFNKNGIGCSHYFNSVSHNRHNVILMGDSLGDAGMDQGVPKVDAVLKIGFLYGSAAVIECSLPKYLDSFDIVLVDDQTMDVVKGLVNLIIESS